MLSESNYNALVKFRSDSIPLSSKDMTDEVSYFKEMEFITPDKFGFREEKSEFVSFATFYKLTPRGEDALAEFEYRASQDAKNDSAKKKEHIFQVFLVFLGAIIGLLIERFSGITDWFSSLF